MPNPLGPLPEPSLVDRCRKWIEKNIPYHSQSEYQALLITNQELMVQLVSKCIAFEDLMKAYRKLQKAIYETTPTAPFMVEVDVHTDVMQRMSKVHTVTWFMDPHRQRAAIADVDMLRSRMQTEDVVRALREHFEREVSPSLWLKAEACLYRAALQ